LQHWPQTGIVGQSQTEKSRLVPSHAVPSCCHNCVALTRRVCAPQRIGGTARCPGPTHQPPQRCRCWWGRRRTAAPAQQRNRNTARWVRQAHACQDMSAVALFVSKLSDQMSPVAAQSFNNCRVCTTHSTASSLIKAYMYHQGVTEGMPLPAGSCRLEFQQRWRSVRCACQAHAWCPSGAHSQNHTASPWHCPHSSNNSGSA
jgi:hypothetical protein